jgi:hypothetical protein
MVTSYSIERLTLSGGSFQLATGGITKLIDHDAAAQWLIKNNHLDSAPDELAELLKQMEI